VNIKEWAKRVLCFVLGAVAAGVLIVGSTSYGEPRQDRITALEQRVAALEKYNKDREEAAKKEAERERQQRRSNEGPHDFRDRP
jgi:Tfp pilus assembly protein PilO